VEKTPALAGVLHQQASTRKTALVKIYFESQVPIAVKASMKLLLRKLLVEKTPTTAGRTN
jgi:hypothetical protein